VIAANDAGATRASVLHHKETASVPHSPKVDLGIACKKFYNFYIA
jgi:hypothetical protein